MYASRSISLFTLRILELVVVHKAGKTNRQEQKRRRRKRAHINNQTKESWRQFHWSLFCIIEFIPFSSTLCFFSTWALSFLYLRKKIYKRVYRFVCCAQHTKRAAWFFAATQYNSTHTQIVACVLFFFLWQIDWGLNFILWSLVFGRFIYCLFCALSLLLLDFFLLAFIVYVFILLYF